MSLPSTPGAPGPRAVRSRCASLARSLPLPLAPALALTALALCLAGPAAGAIRDFEFDTTPPGKLPPGWRATVAGEGLPGDWQVVMDDIPPMLKPLTALAPSVNKRAVVAQLSQDPTDERFPLLVFDQERFGDFTARMRFKIVGGGREQIAGLAFRIQDEKNFYVARVSALGHNLRFYAVVDGKRRAPVGPDINVKVGDWHELGVKCDANRIQIYLDGKEAMPLANDNTFAVGKVGFFTKSDAVTYFTDLHLDYRPLETIATTMTRATLEKNPRLLNLRVLGMTAARKELHVMAAKNAADIGAAAEETDRRVFAENQAYYRKTASAAIVTSPLHDRNGDVIGVAKFFLKPYPGQMEGATINRVLPIIAEMEKHIGVAHDLVE